MSPTREQIIAHYKAMPDDVEIQFRSDYSIFVPNKPKDIKCLNGLCENILSRKNEESIARFGLFGGSNDLNKFYPDLTEDDWTPKEADFIQPVFRALSETIVLFMGIPIDFSEDGVLKQSIDKLYGATVNTNHDTEVENSVGSVPEVSWQEAYNLNGVSVPAGLNAVLKIDAKSNPRLARGILMEPPAIHSTSVTVRFDYKPSHDIEDFWEKLGQFDENGNLYRLVVTNIKSYPEISLVSHGSDPYAQKIDNGKINNPVYADSQYNFRDTSEHNFNYKPFKNANMEFTEILALLGLNIEDVPDMDALVAKFRAASENQVPEGVNLEELQTASSELAALKEVNAEITPTLLTTLMENQRKEGETPITEDQTTVLAAVDELGGIDSIKEQVTLGEKYLSEVRSKAIADYKFLAGDKAQDEIINTIEKADLKAAKAFESFYHTELEEKIPLVCEECGSNKVSRASHKKEPKKNETAENSYKETRDKIARRHRRKPSDIHQKD